VIAGLLVPLNTLNTLTGDVVAPLVLTARWSSRTWMSLTLTLSGLLLVGVASVGAIRLALSRSVGPTVSGITGPTWGASGTGWVVDASGGSGCE